MFSGKHLRRKDWVCFLICKTKVIIYVLGVLYESNERKYVEKEVSNCLSDFSVAVTKHMTKTIYKRKDLSKAMVAHAFNPSMKQRQADF